MSVKFTTAVTLTSLVRTLFPYLDEREFDYTVLLLAAATSLEDKWHPHTFEEVFVIEDVFEMSAPSVTLDYGVGMATEDVMGATVYRVTLHWEDGHTYYTACKM